MFGSTDVPMGINNIVVDIEGTLDKKLASVRCYKSQFPPAKEHVFDRIQAFAIQQGMSAGLKAGETLSSPRMLGTRDLMKLTLL